jgi:hypothetical protein
MLTELDCDLPQSAQAKTETVLRLGHRDFFANPFHITVP